MRKTFCLLLCIGFATPALAVGIPFLGPDDYADCVIHNITPSTAPQAVNVITAECRQHFPQASGKRWFGPNEPRECYNKYQNRAGNREAARAIAIACGDQGYRASQLTTAQ
ncbi:MAG: hypothetical protein V7711_06780 [Pseudomonadales bacterium]